MFCFFACLSQRAWLLKLLAVELHAGDVSNPHHRDACQTILSNLFGQGTTGIDGGQAIYPLSHPDTFGNADFRSFSKSKVLIDINCFMVHLLLLTYFLHAYLRFYIVYYMLNN